MELHDEVLAQLDELDALLSLLISNAVALRELCETKLITGVWYAFCLKFDMI